MLKILACLTMLIDHIGYTFFPDKLWLRIIGRLAYPLFAWYIAIGFRRTHNRGRYLARLLGWGLLSQIPFALLFHEASWRNPISFLEGTNVLFTFVFAVLGLLLITACEKRRWEFRAAAWLGAALFAAAAQWANTDYGAYGVVIVLLFYLLESNAAIIAIGNRASGSFNPSPAGDESNGQATSAIAADDSAINVTYARNMRIVRMIALPMSIFLVTLLSLGLMRMHPIQLYCVAAVPLTYIRFPDPKPGKWKYAFYAFYPAHIFLIWLVTLP